MLDNIRKITNNDYIVFIIKFSKGEHSNRIYAWHFCILAYPIAREYVSFITKLFSLCGCVFRNSFDFNWIISGTWVVVVLHVLDDTFTWLVGWLCSTSKACFVDFFFFFFGVSHRVSKVNNKTISIGICKWFSLTKISIRKKNFIEDNMTRYVYSFSWRIQASIALV